jgi:hypothetical protein
MTDATFEAESEHRLPAAYSQGFAHVRVLTITNADDTGPLAVPISPANPDKAQAPLENAIAGPATRTPSAA